MTKEEILKLLDQEYNQWYVLLGQMDDSSFYRKNNGKWSAAEQAEHLILSVRPITMALTLPRFALRLMFGKPNRKGRSYQEITDKYQAKLAAGSTAPVGFVPKPITTDTNRRVVIERFKTTNQKFRNKISHMSESEMDSYLLPHPLLGKLSLREMFLFTIYHTIHHRHTIEQKA